MVQEKAENTESFEGTIEDTATEDSPTENSFEESFDMENVTTESEPKIEIPEPTVFDNSFLEDSLEEQTFVEDTDLSFERSDVNANIIGNVVSIKNPKSGTITVDSVDEIIIEDESYKGQVIINKK